jgi:hypothetical protein
MGGAKAPGTRPHTRRDGHKNESSTTNARRTVTSSVEAYSRCTQGAEGAASIIYPLHPPESTQTEGGARACVSAPPRARGTKSE